MHDMSLASQIQALKTREFSSSELTQHYLDRIKRLNPIFNALITITEEKALDSAKKADRALNGDNNNELCGIPIVHKDIFCTHGVRTSCGSKMLNDFVPPYDATVVKNLDEAGTIMLGKANMDEFAMGSSNETSFYGSVKNPWDILRVPGGSSGGSAAAVAARMTPAATATDTGGSIRQPAALCGVTGLKPTYGLVSRWGMIAFASSLDQGGPIARTAEDCAILLNAMASFDHRDSTSLRLPEKNYKDGINRSISGCGWAIGSIFTVSAVCNWFTNSRTFSNLDLTSLIVFSSMANFANTPSCVTSSLFNFISLPRVKLWIFIL